MTGPLAAGVGNRGVPTAFPVRATHRHWLNVFCAALYVTLKLIQASSLSSVSKTLSLSKHGDRKAFKQFVAVLAVLNVAHLVVSTQLRYMARTRAVWAVGALLAAVYAVFTPLLAMDIAQGNAVVTPTTQACMVTIAISTVCLDAVADAVCRHAKLYLQPAKRAGALLAEVLLLAQLAAPEAVLPASASLVATYALALMGIAACAIALRRSGDLLTARVVPAIAGGSGNDGDGETPRFLALDQSMLFLAAVLLGDRGEEILDTVQAYELDDQLSLGRRGGMAAKIGIAAAVNVVGLVVFLRNNRGLAAADSSGGSGDNVTATTRTSQRPGGSAHGHDTGGGSNNAVADGPSAGLRGALWVVVVWALFQMARGLVAVGGWGVADQDAGVPPTVMTALVAGDKLIGGLAKDAFGLIQTLSLPFMAAAATTGAAWAARVWLSVDLAGSIAETVKELSGSFIKRALLDPASWLSQNALLVVLLSVPAVAGIHAYMGRRTLRALARTPRAARPATTVKRE